MSANWAPDTSMGLCVCQSGYRAYQHWASGSPEGQEGTPAWGLSILEKAEGTCCDRIARITQSWLMALKRVMGLWFSNNPEDTRAIGTVLEGVEARLEEGLTACERGDVEE